MDTAQAPDNVVELPMGSDKKPTDRELVVRLLELLDAREEMQHERDRVAESLAKVDQSMTEAADEIDSIKRELGASVKRRKGSRPTPAASSTGGSPRGRMRPRIEKLMVDGEWRKPAEVLKALKVTETCDKQAVYNLLRDMGEKGQLRRKRAGKTQAGHRAYAYRSKR